MKNNWQEIWQRKEIGTGDKSLLEKLIDIDGFSSPFGQLNNVKNWEDYIEKIIEKLGIKKGDSIFEVGCGAGAFLYPFYRMGHSVGGIDYAKNLVEVAKESMPQGNFESGDAAGIRSDEKYDFAISNGVFLYFPDYNYAKEVLQRMFAISRKGIGIFDVPDLSRKEESIKERMKTLGEPEYEKKYKGLDHLYYSKDWFSGILGENARVEVLDQFMGGYGNSKFRFNVFIYKD